MLLSTEIDNQSRIPIPLLQGEQEVAQENHLFGTFLIEGIVPAPHGVPQIEVTLDIDANGIINVSARDKSIGRQLNITNTALSKEQIDRAGAPLGIPYNQPRPIVSRA